MKRVTVIPNKGGRIGHQFVEWLSSYVFCRNNNYQFYYHPFIGNSIGLDNFLNLGYNELKFQDFKGKIITINDMELDDYLSSDKDGIYVYDFFNDNKFKLTISNNMLIDDDIRNVLRHKYYNIHKKETYENVISVHVRRDDVLMDSKLWSDRYIGIDYFIRILSDLYHDYPNFNVKIFSSNIDGDFYNIKNIPYKNIEFHVNNKLEDTLDCMIKSKILVTSSSGISFIASLFSDVSNIKVCADGHFWHKWPNESVLKKI